MTNKKKQFTLRLDEDTYEMLSRLADINKMSRQNYIVEVIKADYDKVNGNPELRKMLEDLSELQHRLGNFNWSKS